MFIKIQDIIVNMDNFDSIMTQDPHREGEGFRIIFVWEQCSISNNLEFFYSDKKTRDLKLNTILLAMRNGENFVDLD